jgi:hypothetical protein
MAEKNREKWSGNAVVLLSEENVRKVLNIKRGKEYDSQQPAGGERQSPPPQS